MNQQQMGELTQLAEQEYQQRITLLSTQHRLRMACVSVMAGAVLDFFGPKPAPKDDPAQAELFPDTRGPNQPVPDPAPAESVQSPETPLACGGCGFDMSTIKDGSGGCNHTHCPSCGKRVQPDPLPTEAPIVDPTLAPLPSPSLSITPSTPE